MSVEIITKEDLVQTKEEIIQEMKRLVSKQYLGEKRLLKAKEVMKVLGISPGTLQNMRINGTLPYSMVGGLTYYVYEDILKVIERNMKNRLPDDDEEPNVKMHKI
ncbi:MAG: helix-turn-helix domain-containing protein [Bacteroidales bacterium]|nr:helix-turn-helix domain-containing protein [Bacteroidales bacterium]